MDGLRDQLRDVPWDILKLNAFAAASEFCEWVQIGIDVYIRHGKYQVKPLSSPWFLATFFVSNKCSESKVKFRQASNYCKRIFEAAKLAYATKTKEFITFQKLGSQAFWQIANSVFKNAK